MPIALWLLIAIWLATAWYAHHEFLPYDVNNTDIGTYLFQAQTFADGRIWRPTPEPREFFQQWQAIVRDRSYAYYALGHALFLAIPLALGIDPWIIPWLFSGLSLFIFFKWSRHLFDLRTAAIATVLMAISPFFAANAPSLLSHSTTLFLTLLFLWSVGRWAQSDNEVPRPPSLLLPTFSGIFLGLIFATRSVNAAALALVWIPWIFWTKRDFLKNEIRSWTSFGCGILSVIIPLLVYYRSLCGKWRLDLFTDYWPRNRFGFGQGLGRGEPGHYFQTYTNHDWAGVIKNWKQVSWKLAEWWTGNPWISILLLIFFLFLLVFRSFRSPKPEISTSRFFPTLLVSSFPILPLLAWPLVHIFLYSLYFTPSTFFSGPRYLVEILPALALASGWTLTNLSTKRIGRWIVVLVLGLFVFYSTSFKEVFYRQNARGIEVRRKVEDCVLHSSVKTPSLIFIRSFWLGHPYPIFLNRTDLSGPILYACDRGVEDKRLVDLYPDRDAYILSVAPLRGGKVKSELILIYEAKNRHWFIEPEQVSAPFFIGSKFTPSIELKGETARRLFHPKPEEIEAQ